MSTTYKPPPSAAANAKRHLTELPGGNVDHADAERAEQGRHRVW